MLRAVEIEQLTRTVDRHSLPPATLSKMQTSTSTFCRHAAAAPGSEVLAATAIPHLWRVEIHTADGSDPEGSGRVPKIFVIGKSQTECGRYRATSLDH
jgi:hypothetical protein